MQDTVNKEITALLASALGDASNIEDGTVTGPAAILAAQRIVEKITRVGELSAKMLTVHWHEIALTRDDNF